MLEPKIMIIIFGLNANILTADQSTDVLDNENKDNIEYQQNELPTSLKNENNL